MRGIRDDCSMIRLPIGSMYGIFAYIWVIYRANVSKYSIHGASGLEMEVSISLGTSLISMVHGFQQAMFDDTGGYHAMFSEVARAATSARPAAAALAAFWRVWPVGVSSTLSLSRLETCSGWICWESYHVGPRFTLCWLVSKSQEVYSL